MSPCENEIKITQGHGEHREMRHGVKDTSMKRWRRGGMMVGMISYAKRLKQLYSLYLLSLSHIPLERADGLDYAEGCKDCHKRHGSGSVARRRAYSDRKCQENDEAQQ